MEKFELGIAAQKIYDFIWDEFCDWYIEFSKISGKKEILLWVMINSLKLLHPFMPFVTEKIWLSFVNSEKSIMISEYPISSESLIDENSEKSVTILMSVIKSIRNLRKEMNVPYGKKTTIYIQTEDRMLIDIFEKSRDIICKLAYAKNIEVMSLLNRGFSDNSMTGNLFGLSVDDIGTAISTTDNDSASVLKYNYSGYGDPADLKRNLFEDTPELANHVRLTGNLNATLAAMSNT